MPSVPLLILFYDAWCSIMHGVVYVDKESFKGVSYAPDEAVQGFSYITRAAWITLGDSPLSYQF